MYETLGCTTIPGTALPPNHRATSLQHAIQKHPDYEIRDQLLCEGGNSFNAQPDSIVLVVDVCVDGIATKNPVGIRPRETLAIIIPPDANKMVDVYALRVDFPRTLHTNAAPPDTPLSLCLYAQKPQTILRTWTAERFLARIQEWLQLASENQLHGDDQPPEQLFIYTGDELLIPPNLSQEELLLGRWQISRTDARTQGGRSYFLEPLPAGKEASTAEPFLMNAGGIGHQAVEFIPRTLGELVDIHGERGFDVCAELQKQILSVHQEKNLYGCRDTDFSLLIISATVRTDTLATEQRYAYLIAAGTKELGESLGVLQRAPNGNGYVMTLDFAASPQPPNNTWKSIPTRLMEVLEMPSPALFRKWSGTANQGPRAVLIGAGALGSELINHWVRCGWGQWSVVDDDHIRPHNLARHTALKCHMAINKATAVAHLAELTSNGTAQIVPIDANACTHEGSEFQHAIQNAALIVDATADVQYPRKAARVEGNARHVSVFLTPDGNGAALLQEDSARTIRLHSLEAQYYRAILTEAWGNTHLTGGAEMFWSGRSCRDRSFVMPGTRMAMHAALLAEQVQLLSIKDNACIRIWCRDVDSGAIEAHEIMPMPVVEQKLGIFNVVLDHGLVAELRALRIAAFPNETGGILLGYVDFTSHTIMLVKGLTAPPDSLSTPSEFIRGKEGVAECLNKAQTITMGQVGYVGEWHSHPKHHSSLPSRTDIRQLSSLATKMAEEGLPVVSLIVGDGSPTILLQQD